MVVVVDEAGSVLSWWSGFLTRRPTSADGAVRPAPTTAASPARMSPARLHGPCTRTNRLPPHRRLAPPAPRAPALLFFT